MLSRTARPVCWGGVAWLGRAEQTCQDAGDEIWVAAREFLGGAVAVLAGIGKPLGPGACRR
jgi:hypothetical protein